MSDSCARIYATGELERLGKIMALVVAAGFASLSQAQTSQPGAAPAVPDALTEEIVVSASRIERSGFTAPTPTTVLGIEEKEALATTTVADLLNELPENRPSAPALTSQNTGLVAINLRGLNGANNANTRTLVLVDGNRFVPTTINGVVDSNVVPSALIERVEVVTGGASAAWGSDAVAGVANFIFKKKIAGFQADVQYGQSQRDDDKDTSVSLGWGHGFAGDRGQVMIAGEYNTLRDMQTFGDRGWSNEHSGFVSGTVNGVNVTRILATGLTLSGLTTGGVITSATGGPLAATSPLRGIQFGPGSTVQPFNYGANVGNTVMIGGSGGWFQNTLSIAAPVDRKNIYGRVAYDFTDSVRGYLDLSAMESSSSVPTFPLYDPNTDATITVQKTNGYLQTLPGLASLRAILAANPAIASFSVSRINGELGTNLYVTSNKTSRGVAGLDGDFGGDWHWKAYYTHGETDYDARIEDQLIEPNWRAALDTVVENGQVICRVNSTVAANIALTGAANYAGKGAAPGCVPANLFGAGSLGSNVMGYVDGTQRAKVTYIQDAAAASLQGEPFATWAGKVSLVGGVEYRKESVSGTSDPLSQYVNSVYSNGAYQYGNPKPIAGDYNVKEYFVETVVPLADHAVWARSLDFNAAARRTDYSTSGQVSSWKLGLTYKPIESLLFRGTRSRDIRAPNLNELYASSAQLAFGAVDCGHLVNGVPSTYNSQQVTQGNPKLVPEIADTKTFGLTFQPTRLPSLRASVDYYSIEINKAIAAVTAQNIVNGCYGALGNAVTPAYCALITRDPVSGLITSVTSTNVNFQSISTKGIDYELTYQFDLADLTPRFGGKLGLRLLANNIQHFITNNGVTALETAGEIGGSGGNSLPHWRGVLSATYGNGPWTVFGQARYIGQGKVANAYTATDIANNHIASFTYFDASLQYLINQGAFSRLQVYGKISNILDKDPPVIGAANQNSAPTNANLYDVVGRAFVVGVRIDF